MQLKMSVFSNPDFVVLTDRTQVHCFLYTGRRQATTHVACVSYCLRDFGPETRNLNPRGVRKRQGGKRVAKGE